MEKRFDVPEDSAYNYSMLNKETEQTNRAIDFVTYYSEWAAGCNERFIEWDVKKVLDEGADELAIGLKKEDLGYVSDIFEEEFLCWENCYRYTEVEEIREWIKEKSA